jgi:amidase
VENPFGLDDHAIIWTCGPIARTVDDVAALLDVMAGITVGTPHWAVPPDRPFLELAKRRALPVWQRNTAQVPVHDWALTQPVTRWLGEAGRRVTEAHAAELAAQLSARVLTWFGDVDAWLTPTVAIPPPAIGEWAGLPPEEAFAKAARLGLFTAPFNASGQPAISVPAGLSRRGHPIGAQIVGRPLADATVLAVARQLEEAMPWRDRTARLPSW